MELQLGQPGEADDELLALAAHKDLSGEQGIAAASAAAAAHLSALKPAAYKMLEQFAKDQKGREGVIDIVYDYQPSKKEVSCVTLQISTATALCGL